MDKDLSIKNKTILVVGGYGRLGRSIVKNLLKEKVNIVIGDIDKKGKNLFFPKVSSRKLLYSYLDITKKNSIDKTLLFCKSQFGSLDVCINLSYPRTENWGKDINCIDLDYLTENLKLQLAGPIILSQRLMKYFIDQGHGNFIHCSSIQGISAPKFDHYKGTKMYSPIEYSAVKSGIISVTKWLAKFYKNKNIRVNCISPGGILDGQNKIFLKNYRTSCNSKGMLDAEDILGTVMFLMSDNSKYINGQNIIVDDGWSL